MNFAMRERVVSDVTILELVGNITSGAGETILVSKIKDLIAAGRRKFVFDLSETFYVDSSGLGALVSCYTRIGNSRGQLLICYPSMKITDLLSVTKLLIVFHQMQ